MIAVFGSAFFVVSLAALFIFSHLVSLKKEEYQRETLAAAEAEAHNAALSQLTRTLDETKEDRDSVNGRILKDEDVIGFLALIETLGKEQGVSLSTSALTVEPIDATFERLVMSVAVSGPYQGVIRTLEVLENLPYQSSVLHLQLSRGEAEDGSQVWKSTYDLTITKFKKR
ncbi:MAG TPA: hypothetical protein VFS75_00925 [Candidatus Paceibacterota bacterium]|nr:hypothetical protein [Candidatus Paceibacterota bacterium]